MISRLLIANRGEIAGRVIRTARRMGIHTIVVYSDADAVLPFVHDADEAVRIGPAAAAQSYLNPQRILDAARKTGADAIHPGYGFLSENADFAEAVRAAGLIWVGPPPAAIRAMGLKDRAKKLMAAAGVPVTPGYWGEDQSPQHLASEATRIGYPVLIKAVAGGGGKGMRRVETPVDFQSALDACQREAAASFGDARVLLEKYITAPRHIEVQVFADRHGHTVHLFERDCSLQRRHQKVIEEAPAPGMDAETRKALCETAMRAAEAVNYEGTGTVEFIADSSEGLKADRIWFMEMNTRLQVEHPVTEMITGLDLVEWQLRVAAGEPLPLRQEEIRINGHAMEARLYAENTAAGFLPSTGPLKYFRLPENVRVDTGVTEGSDITSYYDPMIAKIVAHGATRRDAALALSEACAEVRVWPVKTNAGFLRRVLRHDAFLKANIDTDFIPAHASSLAGDTAPRQHVLEAAAHAFLPDDAQSPWAALAGFRLNAAVALSIRVQHDDVVHSVDVSAAPTRARSAVRVGHKTLVFDEGDVWVFQQPESKPNTVATRGGGTISAPMPGHILAVKVHAGTKVAKGAPLVTLEAMKMEHTLAAPFAATVVSVKVAAGDKVSEGAVMLELEADG
jgi:acetyl/propionyl-CoA carboxylase alpha subunit